MDLADLAAQANRDLDGASALEILTWAHAEFGSKLVVASSMADTVLIHLAEQVAPGIDVIFLDTGYHFVETIGTRDAVKLVHNVNVINVTPEQTVAEQDATWGKDLFARDPDQCCAAQGGTPRKGPRTVRRVGHRTATRRLTCALCDPGGLLGREAEVDQGRADRCLDRRGCGALHRTQFTHDQSPARGWLHLHRVRAVHQPSIAKTILGPAVGRIRQDRMRDPPVSAQAATRGRRAGSIWSRAHRCIPPGEAPHCGSRGFPRPGSPPLRMPWLVTCTPRASGSRCWTATTCDRICRLGSASLAKIATSMSPGSAGWPGCSPPWRHRAGAGDRPYAAARDAVRDDHGKLAVPFAEVHVATPLQVAEARDVKGLYARARRGELKGLTGVDDPYEVPTQAELVVDTASVDLDTAVQMSKALLSAIVERDFG